MGWQSCDLVVKAGGSVTAGNASGINDGACALLLASEEAVTKYHLTARARVVAAAVAGVAAANHGLCPCSCFGQGSQ